MGAVVCVFLHRTRPNDGTNWRHVFELPEGLDLGSAQQELRVGRRVEGRMMELGRPVPVSELGLDGEDGEAIRLIREEWPWYLEPSEVLCIENWTGARIGRWDDAVVSSGPPSLLWDRAGGTTPSRLVPDNAGIPVSTRTSWVRPETADGSPVGVVVWVQTYNLRATHGSARAPRGHERFIHYHFQVGDPAIRSAQDLVALLEAGSVVRGWRVAECPSMLRHSVRAPRVIRCREAADLARSDVRMLRPLEHPMRTELTETDT